MINHYLCEHFRSFWDKKYLQEPVPRGLKSLLAFNIFERS
jgi:hypothetical protein